MLGARILRLVGDAEIPVEAAIDLLAVMEGGHAFEILLQAIRQRLVGGVHRGEQGVAALGRALLDVEDAAHRRLEVAAHVGVPALAIGARQVLVGMDDHQLGLARLVRRRRMHMQLAEQPAEGQVLVGRDVLVAEEDHEVLGQRAMDLVLLAVGERLAEIEAVDLGTDDGRQLVDGDGLVRRALIGDVPIAGAGVAAQGSLHGSLLLQPYIATPDDLSPALLLGNREGGERLGAHQPGRTTQPAAPPRPYDRNSVSSRSSASAAPL